MGWSATLGALRRRWYAVAVGLLATVVLGLVALTYALPTYEATGSVLLMPFVDQTEEAGNSLLSLNNLQTTSTILAARMNSDEGYARLAQALPQASYTVDPDPTIGGSALIVTASAATPQSALDALEVVLEEMPHALEDLQVGVGVPESAAIGSMPLTRDIEAEKVTTATERALIGSVGGGILLTAAGAVGLDAIVRRRKPRSRAATRPNAQDRSAAHHARGPARVAARPAIPAQVPALPQQPPVLARSLSRPLSFPPAGQPYESTP